MPLALVIEAGRLIPDNEKKRKEAGKILRDDGLIREHKKRNKMGYR